MKNTLLALATLIALGTGGCASQVADPGGPPPPVQPQEQGLSHRLAEGPVELAAVPVDTEIAVGASLPLSDDEPSRQVLPLRDGSLVLTATPDGGVALQSLALAFDPIRIAPSRLDLELTDVRITMEVAEGGETVWASEDEAYTEVQADILLEWSLVRDDGSTWPLAPQRVNGIPLGVTARRDAQGQVSVDIDGGTEDILFSWSGLAELRGLSVSLRAEEGSLR